MLYRTLSAELEPETVNVFSEEIAEQPDVPDEIAPKASPETISGLQSATVETPQKQWLNLGLIELNAGSQSRKGTSQQTIDNCAMEMAEGRMAVVVVVADPAQRRCF